MPASKSSISRAKSYAEIGAYWDEHDLAEQWAKTKPVAFEVDSHASSIYFPVDRDLAVQLRSAAESHGVSAETLLNLWLQEKVAEEHSAGKRRLTRR